MEGETKTPPQDVTEATEATKATEADAAAAEAAEAAETTEATEPQNTYKIQAHVQEAAKYLAQEEMLTATAQELLRSHYQAALQSVGDNAKEVVELVADLEEGKDRNADLARLPSVLERIGQDFFSLGQDAFELLAILGENRRIGDHLRAAMQATNRPRRQLPRQ
jgi:hypothetical protein